MLLGAALAAGMGCASARPRFPIGLYGVPPEAFGEVRAAGFNTITGPADKEFLDGASEAGLQVLASAGGLALRTNAALRAKVARLDSHPALWAWYLMDEPDLHRIPPPEVALANRALERVARKPSLLVLMSGSSAGHYGGICDLLAVDFYPVPWAPVSQFSKEMRLAAFKRDPKPYFAILQAFDWTAFRDVLGVDGPLRAPTKAELRCMIYMAAAEQADGLFFYAYEGGNGRWRLPEEPLWGELKELVAEVNRHLPLFTAEHVWWSPNRDYLGEGKYNEVRDGRISLRRLRVRRPNPHTPAGDYALVINTTGEPVPFRVELPTDEETAPVLGEEREAALEGSMLEKEFAPYEVAVYGPFLSWE